MRLAQLRTLCEAQLVLLIEDSAMVIEDTARLASGRRMSLQLELLQPGLEDPAPPSLGSVRLAALRQQGAWVLEYHDWGRVGRALSQLGIQNWTQSKGS